ncbi:4Fe-4S dicluster domain-containing protein [Magnetospirillum sp. 64-120]|uniref:4Fe-4S dicluster domain-containing protein n=1 Tax=Magnetospirillum sp. 64-120 TaxID=1895778 RepID=UPI0025C174F6|nr:4Fe-4S dicluster domain-containing protein [Magnetospirillum sp. 64-120]
MSQELSRRALFRRFSPAQDQAPQGPLVAVLGDGCLAVRGITCASCVDPCEPRALKIRPMLGGRGLPTIDATTCTGCGDCLNVCPVGALALARSENGESTPCV